MSMYTVLQADLCKLGPHAIFPVMDQPNMTHGDSIKMSTVNDMYSNLLWSV